jgi:hypothetical protein
MTGGIALMNMVGGFPGGLPTDTYWFCPRENRQQWTRARLVAAKLAIAALVIFAPAFAQIRG